MCCSRLARHMAKPTVEPTETMYGSFMDTVGGSNNFSFKTKYTEPTAAYAFPDHFHLTSNRLSSLQPASLLGHAMGITLAAHSQPRDPNGSTTSNKEESTSTLASCSQPSELTCSLPPAYCQPLFQRPSSSHADFWAALPAACSQPHKSSTVAVAYSQPRRPKVSTPGGL